MEGGAQGEGAAVRNLHLNLDPNPNPTLTLTLPLTMLCLQREAALKTRERLTRLIEEALQKGISMVRDKSKKHPLSRLNLITTLGQGLGLGPTQELWGLACDLDP